MPKVIQYSLFDDNLKIVSEYDTNKIDDNKKIFSNNYTIKNYLKFIDLFAGIGGIRIAWERLGVKCVFSSEWDKYAQKTYQANFNEIPYGDISKISAESIPAHDILCGGFPCQPFSSIGKREGFEHPTQGTLFYDIIRILEDKKPIAFLLENVEGIVNHDRGKTKKTIINSLENLNYSIFDRVLNAANYGVPQNRKRIYFVGFNRCYTSKPINFIFPEGKTKSVDIGNFIESHSSGYGISKHLQKSYLFKKDDGRPELIDKNTKGCVKTLVSTYHKIQRLTGTFVKDGDTGIRLLSENECKAIMGFPQDFIVPVSRTQMYRQFGNSVAIPVIEAIAKKIIETIYSMNVSVKN